MAKRFLLLLCLIALLNTQIAHAEPEESEDSSHSVPVKILLYPVNRVLDAFDIFRLRLRVGPGFGAGARITEPASAFFGGYATLYAGLPGPRGGQMPRSPIGFEARGGAQISELDLADGGTWDPDYSETEIGADLHLGILGFSVGFDPREFLDFFEGIFFLDIQKDDL